MKHWNAFGTLMLALSLAASGQTRGAISGVVTDPAGASIPNAKVRVAAPSIGLVRDTVTNESGYFTVPSLPAGDYDVTVEAPGFKSLVRSGLRLDADAVLSLTLALEIGQVTERLEVIGEAPLVETAHGEISRMVTQQQLQNFALPDAILSTCWASCQAWSAATATS